MYSKKLLSLLLSSVLLFGSGISASAKNPDAGKMAAPTVIVGEDGRLRSTLERERRTYEPNITPGTELTLKAGENNYKEFLTNSGFETYFGATVANWEPSIVESVDGVYYENRSNMSVDETAPKFGTRSLHLKHTDDFVLFQSVSGMVRAEVELSGWVKRNSEDGTPYIGARVAYTNPDDFMILHYQPEIRITFEDIPVGEWAFKTVRFELPEDYSSIYVDCGLLGGGDAMFDDVSLIAQAKPAAVVPMPDYVPAPEGVENLFYDPGFEKNSFEYIEQAKEREDVWFSRENTFGGMWEITTDEAHSGSHSLRLKYEQATSMPWVAQTVPVEEGKEYMFSAWVKFAPGTRTMLRLQADAYIGGVEQTSETYSKDGQIKSGAFNVDPKSTEWQRVTYKFNSFVGIDYYCFLLRVGADSPYEMYLDDIEVYPIGMSSDVVRKLDTDNVFYYADWVGIGTATFTTHVDRYEWLKEASAHFKFLDGDKVIKEEIVPLGEDGAAEFIYDLDLMAEKKKEYAVSATLINPDGTETDQTRTRYIYRYDRPTQLDENMKFVNNGGQVINYVLGQQTIEEVMYKVGEANATVGRAIGSPRTSLLEKLDIAYANGMMATVTLYNHSDIRDPEVYEYVVDRINLVKDHPALFGWYLWEEPAFHGDDIDLEENLRIGTKLIRDLDPVHPIGSVISEADYFGRLARYNDWMDLDCYPAQAYGRRARYIAECVNRAMQDTDWQKNMSLMVQGFKWFDYKPTWDEMRNFIYQSFFEGGSGFSFHAFGSPLTLHEPDGIIIGDEIFTAMSESKWEYDFMFDHFVNEKYPLYNEASTYEYRWRLAVVEDALYAIVLNMDDEAEHDVAIKLESYDGKVKVEGFTAELLAGGEKHTVTEDGDTLNVKLPGFGAYLYKITPNTAVDFSGVKGSRFRDLSGHTWAREAIIALDEKGIVNEKSAIAFGAKDNITRGEFAMFLVRSLGLTTGGLQNFDDVKANAVYAKELSIGRAAGILEGVGDNKFNPEAEITRQDMMVMTSRALKLKNAGDLSAFSDNASVADYAKDHVAAMVAEGLVKGNADGTVNPLGNTTRAEAAMICWRILNK